MKIVLVGGGTGGPVTPLVAVSEAIAKLKPKTVFYYFGGNSALESRLVGESVKKSYFIPAGKWRRYWSLRNFYDIVLTIAGFLKSVFILARLRPEVVFSAGAYVSVPVGLAAKLLGIKLVIHQQDVTPSLSNRLLYPFADKLTTALDTSRHDFFHSSGLFRQRVKSKIVVTGNPVRQMITEGSKSAAESFFKLEKDLPTLLVLGGGTGSKSLNVIVEKSLPELTKHFQVIHLTGEKKALSIGGNPRYKQFAFIGRQLPDAIKAADIVVSRAGFATISELAVCRKVCIFVALPGSQQEENAIYLFNRGAAIAYPEQYLRPQRLVGVLRKLLFDSEAQQRMKKNFSALFASDGAEKIAKIIVSYG